MSFDPERWDDDNQARLRTIAGVSVGSVESIDEVAIVKVPLPFVATLYAGAESEGRMVAGQKTQQIETQLSIIVVSESWRSREGGRDGALRLIKAVKETFVTRGARKGEWQNPQAAGPFVYRGDRFIARLGRRIAYQVDFAAPVYDDFEP